MTDAKLVQQARQGDADAYRQLVERYRDAVYGLAYHHVQSFEDARDIAQEALLKAYLNLPQLRDASKFGPWLRRVTVNECRMWQRRPRPEVSLEDLRGQPDEPTHDLEVDRLALRLAVRQALQGLSETTRLTLTLYYLDGYSQREIAEFLGVPVTTVKGRLRDARARLRKELQEMVENTFKQEALRDDFTERVMARIVGSLSDAADRPYVLLADEEGRQLPLQLDRTMAGEMPLAQCEPLVAQRSRYHLLGQVLSAFDIRLTEVRLQGTPDTWEARLVCQQGEQEREVAVHLTDALALVSLWDVPVALAEQTFAEAAWSAEEVARLGQPVAGPLQLLPSGAGLLSRPEPDPSVFVSRELIDSAGLQAGDQLTVTVQRLRPLPWERYLLAERVVSACTAEGTFLAVRSFTLADVPSTTVHGPLAEQEPGFLLTENGTNAPPVYIPRLPFLQPGDRVALRVREPREYERFRRPLALEEINGQRVSTLLGLGAWDTVPHLRRGPRRTALVINDEAHVRRLLAVNLERAGWAVAVAEDGIIGLEKARETRPDVILCDELMPRQDGYDTVRQLQAEAATASVPILMFVFPRIAKRIPNPPPQVAAYVAVPFDPREVLALMEAVATAWENER